MSIPQTSTRSRMRARLFALGAVACATAACFDSVAPSNRRFGTISAATYADGGVGFVMSPEAVFYGESNLTFASPATDSCVVTGYSPTATINGSLLRLDAGGDIITQVSGRTDSLEVLPGLNLLIYRAVRSSGIPFVPGDTLTVVVPGATGGFPQAAISVKTAEPFTNSGVVVPAPGADLPLTWTPAATPGSFMTFSLRYANVFSTGAPNEQVYCSFIDDGSATIDDSRLGGWLAASSGSRSSRASRLRSREVIVDSRTRLVLISTFGQPPLTLLP